jgi:Tol biopolymer transport system component
MSPAASFLLALGTVSLCLACAGSGTHREPPPEPPAPPGETLLGDVRQLTFAGRRAGEGYFSADGKRLVFQSEREPGNPFFQIYVMERATGETRRISPGYGKTTCGWLHPSGTRVLFASTHLDPRARAEQKAELEQRASGRRYSWDFDEDYELFEADLAGGGLRRLTRARGYDAEASWSPDGRSIVFASNRHAFAAKLSPEERTRLEQDPAYFMDLYVMDAQGKRLRRLTDTPGYDGGPFWSPDGRRIVWRRFSEQGDSAEIFTMNADGGDVRQLTRLGALSWAPFYHPSGAYVIFATNVHGFDDFELYLVDAEGRGEPVRVTTTKGFDGLPAFSPDGATLAWTTTRTPDASAQIFLADWDHASARSLVELRAFGAGAQQAAAAPEPQLPAETSPAIRADDLRARVSVLASERMAGRLTGTEGERLATGWVADQMRALGLEPAGEGKSYFAPFDFTAGISLGAGNELRIHPDASPGGAAPLVVDRDWRPLSFSSTGSFPPAPLAFAGYGLVAGGATGQPSYDSYAGLDVAGRFVLVLRFAPEGVEPERRQYLARFASLRQKAMLARERGAAGLLVASGPRSHARDPLVPLGLDAAVGSTSLPVISVSDDVARTLLAAAGQDLDALNASLDGGEPVAGFAIPGTRIEAKIDLVQEKRTGRSVVGRLASGKRGAPPLVIGAHVDHLGRGEGVESLARDDERGQIHFGADDNASGVATLLEIAEWLSAQARSRELAPSRDVLFAAWSGEELGLLGSAAFVESLPDPHHGAGAGGKAKPRAYAAYLNMDMVGRLDGELVLHGVGSSPIWPALVERHDASIGLPIALQQETYLPTDATSFYLKGVPILSAFTGAHEEYHTPRDTPDLLDYDGMERVARLFAGIAGDLATRADLPEVAVLERPAALPPRAGLRAYLGTIPSYGRVDVRGVKLAGVASGGPAEQAGLRAGDVIVELAGHSIESIYDYTYAIDLVKIGEPAEIHVLRGEERLVFRITPASRE